VHNTVTDSFPWVKNAAQTVVSTAVRDIIYVDRTKPSPALCHS